MPVIPEIYVDALWVAMAFLCGLLARRLGQPALTGFLLTGILLNFLGLTEGRISPVLHTLSDLGVMLMLFTIGLKVKIKSLLKPEVWVAATGHMILSVVVGAGLIMLLSYTGLTHFGGLDTKASLILSFAMSFSSTVFVVKILEERGELSAFHGKIAIGILVIQDLFAVLFLTVSKLEAPSYWALGLPIYLWLMRLLMSFLLQRSGHGELLTVFGFFATFVVGAAGFSVIGLKPDLGALFAGMLLVGHPKSEELYDRMMNYKDFFLIAFFIAIGLKGIPDGPMVGIGALLLVLAFLKTGLFIFLFSFFRLRARTAFLSALSLGNFSEFGLIVLAIGAQNGWIDEAWLLIAAVAMSFSFFAGSPLNARAHDLFDRFRAAITLLNRGRDCIDTEIHSLGGATHLVVGMGSLGVPAYHYLNARFPGKVIGIDFSHERVSELRKQGLNVAWGDASNSLFWESAGQAPLETVLLAMSAFAANKQAMQEIAALKERLFRVGVIAHYEDEKADYFELKADFVYDYKSYVGADFAEQVLADPKPVRS